MGGAQRAQRAPSRGRRNGGEGGARRRGRRRCGAPPCFSCAVVVWGGGGRARRVASPSVGASQYPLTLSPPLCEPHLCGALGRCVDTLPRRTVLDYSSPHLPLFPLFFLSGGYLSSCAAPGRPHPAAARRLALHPAAAWRRVRRRAACRPPHLGPLTFPAPARAASPGRPVEGA